MKRITTISLVGFLGAVSVYLLLLSHLLGNVFNNTIIYLVISVCGVVCFLHNLKDLTANKRLTVFLLFFVFVFFSTLVNFQFSISSLIYSVLWFFVFNIAFSVSLSSARFLKIVTICFFIAFLAIVMSSYFYGTIVNINGFYTVTAVYYLICFIPFVLLIKQKLLKIVLFSSVVVISILSFKRGALLAIGLIMAIFIIYYLFKKKKKGVTPKSFVYLFAFAGLIFFLYLIVDNKYGVSKILSVWQYRSDTGANSGFFGDVRSEIYLDVLKLSFSSNPFQLLLGHGYDSVILNTSYELSAHNDLLEILFDFGLIACFFYFVFLIMLITKTKKVEQKKIYSYLSFLIIFIVIGLVSHMITYPTYVYILMIYLGIFERSELYENRNINIPSRLQLRS